MADIQNLNKVDTNITSKPALITDLDDTYKGKEIYSHARNIDPCTHEGNAGTLSNSMSNIPCVTLPYTYIGNIPLNDGRYVVFSGDNFISEIGILNERTCEYTKVVNSSCLNFKIDSPITGEAKMLDNNDIIITFRDDISPVRRMNLNKIPYTYTEKNDACKTKVFTPFLDCDEILLFPKISIPNISLSKTVGDSLLNGTYAVAIAYVVDNQKYSDYYSITNRIHLHSTGDNNAFDVSLTNLDRGFDHFQLIVIQNSKGVKTAKVIGTYPTTYTNISVTDFDNPEYITISLSDLVIQKNTFEKAGIISANSNYLILADLTRRAELNYQPQAMKIDIEYTVEQVPEDYYTNSPEDISFYRDENYAPSIQWLFDTGEWSPIYHIPGRKKKSTDKQLASGKDVYEHDGIFKDCVEPGKIEVWQVENTADNPRYINSDFTCDRRFYAYGKPGYFESTEKYPDNLELYGEDACTPIRYPKMPDECKVPRYSKVAGKTYLNILGFRFKNITYPVDDNGQKVKGIVGYRIVRADRKGGNKTIIARGLATNVRKYTDIQNKKEIWYANYPYNDLRKDSFISSTQTVFKNKKENNFKPLTEYFTDKFNFYTPHGNFQPKYKMGTEFKFETEEIANVEGNFEVTFGHPKHKLLTQFSFWLSLSLGALEGLLTLSGKTCLISKSHIDKKVGGADSGVESGHEFEDTYCIEDARDLIGVDPIKLISDSIKAGKGLSLIKKIRNIFLAVTAAGLKVATFGLWALQYADNILAIINNFTGEINYAYQYNSHALFNESLCIKKDYKRRRVTTQPEYLSSNLHTIRGTTFNNFGKQDSILVELNLGVKEPKTLDNSRQTISEFGLCGDPTKKAQSKAVAYYATSKIVNPNQYGQIGGNNQVTMHNQVNYVNIKDKKFESPIIYGGDCIITKFAIQTKHQFFSQNLATTIDNELPTNFPNNTEYDYRLYRNIGYPRFWIDTTRYDFTQLLSKNVMNYSKFSRTTTSKYNLDCKSHDKGNAFRVDDSYFYTSNNGVMEFYVESDHNISFREKTKYPFYSKDNSNLTEIFKAPYLWFPEEFKINEAFKDLQTNEIYARQLRDDFKKQDNKKLRNKNAVIYSLPSYNLQSIDNWQYFLPANYFSFNQSDFGNLTAIHKIDQDRLIYLFDRSSPFISLGRDEIQTLDGRKVTIGDGGMFAREPRELIPTDVNYGSCQSKYAFSSNQFGYFYPSQSQGRYFNYTSNLDDLSRSGIYYWCKKFMPIQLYDTYKTYPKEENPQTRVGYHMVFDNDYEILYLTKRDFEPKKEYEKDIIYNTTLDQFEYKGSKIELHSSFFEDISWTLSYSPKDKNFISWHDWHPDAVIQSENHFMTVKGSTIWKHNETCTSFCNYYGKDYPFEIEYVDSDGQIVMTRKSIEYIMEAYHYKNNCRDKFHILNQNFDNLRVYNTEQCSPLYNLTAHPKTKYGSILFPRRNKDRFDILFAKVEQKYRVNQFWDNIKDRGEFTNNEFHIWVNHGSGYKKVPNPLAINLDKPEKERKQFRHYFTKFLLSKEVSGNTKYIFKFFNTKKTASPR